MSTTAQEIAKINGKVQENKKRIDTITNAADGDLTTLGGFTIAQYISDISTQIKLRTQLKNKYKDNEKGHDDRIIILSDVLQKLQSETSRRDQAQKVALDAKNTAAMKDLPTTATWAKK